MYKSPLFKSFLIAVLFLFPSLHRAAAQTVDVQAVLDRLDRLEEQNQHLEQEIQELRKQLTAKSSPEAERLDVQENRTAELDQSKVGASQRYPVTLTGMLLFNAFMNGRSGGSEYPVVASQTPSGATDGATLRQTVLGLRFNGPDLPGGGKASGSIYMDFFSGTTAPNNNLVRLRIATLDLAWKNTTISVGQDKPIISPRDPESLAQVGVSPLTAAGNLWDWNPQVRFEQRFHFTDSTGLLAQAGVYETTENYPGVLPGEYSGTLERSRPSYQDRFEFFTGHDNWRVELAPGFANGTTHVAGVSLSSQIASFDWLIRPLPQLEFTGEFFKGHDVAGLGALQGFTITDETVNAVHSNGEWGQITLFPAARFSFHIYAGEQANRPSDLVSGSIARNFVYAGNLIWKLAPNVRAALEASQTRTQYLGSMLRLSNHYDLALAYLF